MPLLSASSMTSILARIFNTACTSADHWWEKVISVVHAATRAVFQFTSNCTDPGSTFKTAPESFHVIIDIQNTHTSTETKHIDKADTEPSFVISIEPIYDCNACTGLDVENTDKIVAATPAVNDSGDETAIDFVSDTDCDSTSNAAFDANTEYSDDYTLATDKVAMVTKTRSVVHPTTTSSRSMLDHAYASINMHKIRIHRAEFFCWSDTVFNEHIAYVHAALPANVFNIAKTTQLLLDGLYLYHDIVFTAAQAMSKRLLAQRRSDGLTSPELRQILDTVHVF
ncbi:hypothetical protein GGI17_006181 [Coemansia sp. S146]|nr:hypothetical protein GGI17_006181 [Coemansia sp. S146]